MAGPASTLEIGEAEMPVPKLGQVLIKIEYTALNRADVMQVFIVQIKRFCRETGLTLHLQVPQRS